MAFWVAWRDKGSSRPRQLGQTDASAAAESPQYGHTPFVGTFGPLTLAT
ncbi:MAG: hypothetical protein AAF747_05060 [Planctomycetota bacterium]